MKEYIVFLDIDGVLNTKESWLRPFSLVDECIKNFCAFVKRDKISPKIILTSSWETGWSSIIENQTPQISELQDRLSIYGCSIYSRTKDLGNRQKEILEYLKNHLADYYVIIDDDETEYKGFELSGIYIIDAETGFSKKDVKRIKWTKIKNS